MARRRRTTVLDDLVSVFGLAPWWAWLTVASGLILCVWLEGGTQASGGVGILPLLVVFLCLAVPGLSVLGLVRWAVYSQGRSRRRKLVDSAHDLDAIKGCSWQQFELLVGEAFRRDGYVVEERGGAGADGGIDLIARRAGWTLLIQCKQWRAYQVGVRVVREMFGVMAAERATGVVIVTVGSFTREARDFAEGKPIMLMDGPSLLEFLGKAKVAIPPVIQPDASSVEAHPIEPLCPTCNAPMVRRVARRGENSGGAFLGCSRYPACRRTRQIP
jgi:restriction system protein